MSERGRVVGKNIRITSEMVNTSLAISGEQSALQITDNTM